MRVAEFLLSLVFIFAGLLITWGGIGAENESIILFGVVFTIFWILVARWAKRSKKPKFWDFLRSKQEVNVNVVYYAPPEQGRFGKNKKRFK